MNYHELSTRSGDVAKKHKAPLSANTSEPKVIVVCLSSETLMDCTTNRVVNSDDH